MRAMWTRFYRSLFVKRNLLLGCPPLREGSDPDVHTLGRMLFTGQLKEKKTPKNPKSCLDQDGFFLSSRVPHAGDVVERPHDEGELFIVNCN